MFRNVLAMTHPPDIINQNINKYASAMDALAKGEEMESFVPDELWEKRMHLMSAMPIEAIDEWTKAAKQVIELKIQLAERDALIERLVDEGEVLMYRLEMRGASESELDDWDIVIDEYPR